MQLRAMEVSVGAVRGGRGERKDRGSCKRRRQRGGDGCG